MKEENDNKPLVPEQEKGAKSDTKAEKDFESTEEAKAFFLVVKERLLNVNNWHALSGKGSAEFCLMDKNGNKVDRLVQKDDYFRIDIPGPESEEGDGYDWVQVEAIEEEADDLHEHIAIRVKPASNPNRQGNTTSHFFQNDASSTFLVERKGNTVSSEIHGRNELPNVDQPEKGDVIRNAFVAFGAMIGFSKIQWGKLAKGFVSEINKNVTE